MRKTVQIASEIKKEFSEIHFSAETIIQFEQYFEILRQWNQKINLTAIRDPRQMIVKHLFDSLAVCKTSIGRQLLFHSTGTLMDLGSGAGIPGIILLIGNPLLNLISIDKSKKKIGFQEFVIAQLGLINGLFVSERVESLIASRKHEKSVDFIVSRAFDQIKDLFDHCRFFLNRNGRIILWKGKEWRNELNDVPASLMNEFQLLETCEYQFGNASIGGTILVFGRAVNR